MRTRLFLAFAFLVLVTLLGVAFFVRQSAAQEIRTFVTGGGMFGAQELVADLELYYAANGGWQGVETVMAGHMAGNGAMRAAMQSNGRGRGPGPGASGTAGQGMMTGMMTSLRLTDVQGNVVFDPEDPQADGRLDLALHPAAVSLQVAGRTVGYLVPPDGTALSADALESSLLARLNRASLNAALLAGGLALVLATLLAYSLLRPVRNLTQAAHRLSDGDLNQRAVVSGPDELAVLGRTFNEMADSLQEANARRQAMTADIAHELRTPLAVQRANLEALQDGVYPLTTENLEPILEQNQLLTRLVADLRTLALADAGELSLERRPTDLAALALGLADRFQPQAARRQVSLQTEISRGCPPLNLDPDRIEQILSNLLDNALRHTPAGGTIAFRLDCGAGEAVITVRDTGPGIPQAVLPQIFERFFRADRARSRQEGGTGLGLAIARQLAEAHGGTLAAANHPHGGAEFQLTLPV